MNATVWLGFAATALLIELTPGPNMAWLTALTLSEGKRSGFAAVGGVATGLTLLGIAAAAGLASLVAEAPGLATALHWAGVAYLLYLAWEAWRTAAPSAALSVTAPPRARRFLDGVLTNLLNPKAALFYLSVLPAFIAADQPVVMQVVVLTGTSVAIATVVHLMIVALADRLHGWLSSPSRNRMVRRTMAISLALIALWFALAQRPLA